MAFSYVMAKQPLLRFLRDYNLKRHCGVLAAKSKRVGIDVVLSKESQDI
jgi:hypothetical protein